MPITPGQRLAGVLGGSAAPGAFSAQLSVPARDVRLTVAGAGPISFPVKAPQAKRMIASARPARFGRGEQTLMDLRVRDTWEITPDQVTLTGLDWDAILAEVRDELGLPSRARLRAEPHALLVYGKGQFFLPHQDSEKDDTMIGTLAALAARYDEPWHQDLLDAWFGSRNTWRYTGDLDRKDWAGGLTRLTAALRDAGATATAGWLLAASWGWLDDDIRLWRRCPLVLTKTDELFRRDATTHQDAVASPEWLATASSR